MTITITLPDVLAAKLETEAHARNRSAAEVAIELLDQALEGDLDLELNALVAKIRALPPDPSLISQPIGSLEDYLAKSLAEEAEEGVEFDHEAWQRDWNAFEAELKYVESDHIE
jgi:hypothetical protein